MQVNRRLYRCRDNRVLAGVAGGVAEYFDVDPSLVRVFWFLSIFVGGFGVLLYIAMAIIVPPEPLSAEAAAAAAAGMPEGHRHVTRGSGRATTFVGIGLVLFGTLALIGAALPTVLSWHLLWPAFIIGIGALLIAGAVRRERAQP
jgi:phage shock protein C